jgi:hypothetical protein
MFYPSSMCCASQVADVVRLEDSRRAVHLERLLGVPIRDPTTGILPFMHSRRHKM